MEEAMLKHCKTVKLVGVNPNPPSVRLFARFRAADGRFIFSVLQTARHRAVGDACCEKEVMLAFDLFVCRSFKRPMRQARSATAVLEMGRRP
jgi:hypothetical protein